MDSLLRGNDTQGYQATEHSMGNAFFVVWRESLEAFLIAGILYAWLQANDDTGMGKRALFIGLGCRRRAGTAARLGAADGAGRTDRRGAGNFPDRHALRRRRPDHPDGAVDAQTWPANEGETARRPRPQPNAPATRRRRRCRAGRRPRRCGNGDFPLRHGAGRRPQRPAHRRIGRFAGAGATAWLAAKSLAKLNIGLLLRLSSILLLILASALLIAAIDRLIGAGWLPPLLDPVWDSSLLIDDTTKGRQTDRRFLRLPRPPGAEQPARLGHLLGRRLHRLAEKCHRG
jgi:high-affinity iron transporter